MSFRATCARLATVAVTVVAVTVVTAVPAQAAPDATFTLRSDRPSATWSPPRASAQRTVPAGCGKQLSDYCHDVLIELDAQSIRADGRMDVFIKSFDPAASDFNLYVYESDSQGGEGRYVGRGSGFNETLLPPGTDDPTVTGPGEPESMSIPIGTMAARWYLVRVVYVSAVNATFRATVSTFGLLDDAANHAPSCYAGGTRATSGAMSRFFPYCVDDEGDELTYSIVATPGHGTVSGPSLDDSGRVYFDYTSEAGYVGTDSFSYVAHDGDLTSPVATYYVDVQENAAPDCWADRMNYEARRGRTARVAFTCYDNENDPIRYRFSEEPGHGTVTSPTDGDGRTHVLLYTNGGGTAATDWFTVIASDGVRDSDALRFQIDVRGDVVAQKIPGPQPAEVWLDDRDEVHACTDLDGYRLVEDPTYGEFVPTGANHLAFGLEPSAGYGYDCEIDRVRDL